MHTPGPWTLSEPDAWPFDILITHGEDEVVTMRRHAHSTDQKTLADCLAAKGFDVDAKLPDFRREAVAAKIAEQRANARLIAAAPDLYEVAKGYEAWEADVIENADWRAPTPKLTQAQFDRLLELQAMRNAALSKVSQQQGSPQSQGQQNEGAES